MAEETQINPTGRPPFYTTPEELETMCESYFLECQENKERPTVTGLALFLGYCSKQSIYDNIDKPIFSYPLKKSLLRIENALERKLENNSVAGVIFALKNMGWKDKTEVEQSGNVGLNITGMQVL